MREISKAIILKEDYYTLLYRERRQGSALQTEGEQIMDALMTILSEIRPDVDFETETTLLDNGILDSFDIISIVGEVNTEFDVEIKVESLLPENFNSAEAIYELICKLQDE